MEEQPQGCRATRDGGYASGSGRGDYRVDGPGEEAESWQASGQDGDGGRDFDRAGGGETGGGRLGEAV
ncbi:MAG TPA: hypothetical protein VIS29_09910, partial [Streptomyces sp.]